MRHPLIPVLPGPVASAWRDSRIDAVCARVNSSVDSAELNDAEWLYYSIPALEEYGSPLVQNGDEIDSNKLEVNSGDVLISKLNPRKSRVTTVVAIEGLRTVASTEFVALRPLAIEGRYLSWFLQSEPVRALLASRVESVTRSHQRVNPDDITKLRIRLPGRTDQTRIANFLDEQTARIDALIAEKERLLETLDEHRYAHLSRLMTHGLAATAPRIQTSFQELGEVPAHWSVKRLKFLGEVRSGIAKGKDHGERDTVMLPYLRVANVQDGYVDLTDVQEIEVGSKEVDRYLLRAGDVLMNEGGDNDKLGRGTVWEGQIAPCVHQNHVFAVRLRNAELGEWVARFTSTDAARTYFFLRSKQSTNLASINQSNVRELPIPMPPEEERRDILTEVRRSEDATASLLAHTREHIDRLREYRSSLISAAVTGKLNIDDVEARQVEAA